MLARWPSVDAGIALDVVVGGFLIKLTGYNWIDPVMCFLIIIVVAWKTWGVLQDSVNLALDAVPDHINVHAVQKYLLSVKGVKQVYDLHIGAMSTAQSALSAHLWMPDMKDQDRVLQEIGEELNDRFEISHSKVQISRCIDPAAEQMDCLKHQLSRR